MSGTKGGNAKNRAHGAFSGGGRHLRRALSIEMDPGELLADERPVVAGLPGGSDATYGRLLLWRRSMLYVAFFALLPSLTLDTISAIIELASPTDLGGLPADPDVVAVLGGLGFLVVCLQVVLAFGVYTAFKRWGDWGRSRKILLVTWIIAFLAPFAVALFPARSVGGGNANVALVWGLLGALSHVIALAPKVLALIPGLLRAAVSAKVLFPRSTAPGWLVTLTSPFYLLLLFVIMMLPYQLTGSPLLVLAMLCFLLGPVWLWRSGTALAKPTSGDEAVAMVKKTRGVSIALNGAGALFLVVGVLTAEMGFDVLGVVKALVGIVANIFILSVVAIDVLVGGMTRAYETAQAQALEDADPIASFLETSRTVAVDLGQGESDLAAAQDRSKP